MHREETNYCHSFIQWRRDKQQENKISALPLVLTPQLQGGDTDTCYLRTRLYLSPSPIDALGFPKGTWKASGLLPRDK